MSETLTKKKRKKTATARSKVIPTVEDNDSPGNESFDKENNNDMKKTSENHEHRDHHEHHEHHEKKHADSPADEVLNSVDQTAENLKDKVQEEAIDLSEQLGEKSVQIKQSELDLLKKELDEAKDRGLRALAELENYRSRTNRIMDEDRKYASLDLARAILPVWDNMGRAIEAAEKDLNPEAILDGLKMMHKQFFDILQHNKIEKIEALHKPFDPNFHESIASLPCADYPANTVIVESQPGFKLHQRVVRPTQVVLAASVPVKAPQPETPSES